MERLGCNHGADAPHITYIRENYARLGLYLLEGDLRFRFCMDEFLVSTSSRSSLNRYRPTAIDYQCGTAACALGHGPAAGIPMLWGFETWMAYFIRCFADHYGASVTFSFCFGADWPDSARDAACRIAYYLTHGRPDDDEWFSDMEYTDDEIRAVFENTLAFEGSA